MLVKTNKPMMFKKNSVKERQNVVGKKIGFGVRDNLGHILVLLLICVTLGQTLNIFKPLFLY